MLCVFYFIFYLCSKSVLAPCTWYRRVLDFKLYLRSISCAWLKDVLDIDLYLTSSYSCNPPCKISRSAEVSLALVTLETLLKIKNKLQMGHIVIVSRCAWRFIIMQAAATFISSSVNSFFTSGMMVPSPSEWCRFRPREWCLRQKGRELKVKTILQVARRFLMIWWKKL